MHVVFVHGALVRDGAWWWHRVGGLLKGQCVGTSAAVLPSCGETGLTPGAGGPGYAEDVAAVRAHLTALQEPSVVVAHSYGGVVVSEAAAAMPFVDRLFYISSYLPLPGESLASFGSADGPAPYIDLSADGTFGLRTELTTETFLQDVTDPELVAGAHERLVRQTAAVTVEPVKVAAWQDIRTTYLVCAADRGTPPQLQRQQAARADRTVELPSGHHPFLSMPEAVADLVLGY